MLSLKYTSRELSILLFARSSVGRQSVHLALALALLHGFLVEQLVLRRIQISVSRLDGAITDASHRGNLLGADRLAEEVSSHEDAGSRNRQWRSTSQGANLTRLLRDVDAYVLDIRLVPDSQLRNVSSDQVVGTGRALLIIVADLGNVEQ